MRECRVSQEKNKKKQTTYSNQKKNKTKKPDKHNKGKTSHERTGSARESGRSKSHTRKGHTQQIKKNKTHRRDHDAARRGGPDPAEPQNDRQDSQHERLSTRNNVAVVEKNG